MKRMAGELKTARGTQEPVRWTRVGRVGRRLIKVHPQRLKHPALVAPLLEAERGHLKEALKKTNEDGKRGPQSGDQQHFEWRIQTPFERNPCGHPSGHSSGHQWRPGRAAGASDSWPDESTPQGLMRRPAPSLRRGSRRPWRDAAEQWSKRSSEELSGNPSEAIGGRSLIRGHQRPSEANSGHQRPSVAISGHQWPPAVMSGHQ